MEIDSPYSSSPAQSDDDNILEENSCNEESDQEDNLDEVEDDEGRAIV